MSDERLRWELQALGFDPPPITDSTRDILKKKLKKLREQSTKKRQSNGEYSAKTAYKKEEERRSNSWVKPAPSYVSRTRKDEEDEDYEDDEEEEEEVDYDNVTIGRTKLKVPERRSFTYGTPGLSSTLRGGASLLSREGSLAGEWGAHRRSLGDSSLHLRSVPYIGETNDSWRRDTSLGGEHLGRDRTQYDYGHLAKLGSTTWDQRSNLAEENHDRNMSRAVNKVLPRSIYRYGSDDDGGPKKASSVTDFGVRKSWDLPRKEDNEHRAKWKSKWSRTIEYYLARMLWGLSVLLLIVFFGILIVKSGILNTQQDSNLKLLPSDCSGRGDQYCKSEQKKITFQILSELYDFLSLEAGRFECGNPSGLSSKCVPIDTAREHVANVSGQPPEKFDAALEWVLTSDKHMGIWVRGRDPEEIVSEKDVAFCMESSRPRLGIGCRMKNAFFTALSNLFLAVLVILILWLFLLILRYHWRRLEEEEKQMFDMVEKIIDAVKSHHKDWLRGEEHFPFIGIVHVRDTLIPPQQRKALKKVWNRAVQFLNADESRLRTENHRVSGEDLMVWRWTKQGKISMGATSTPQSPGH
ncbi:LEM domain-containing protein 2 [Bombina bombina]|uniref:LEM domain-containing protein 2 n=1 Tax=Bombina bombina TaxID=8345 RepID=UPI00235A79FB|nr:LEM domain-containing protein 2 [Bombina bombina]